MQRVGRARSERPGEVQEDRVIPSAWTSTLVHRQDERAEATRRVAPVTDLPARGTEPRTRELGAEFMRPARHKYEGRRHSWIGAGWRGIVARCEEGGE